MTFKKLLIAFVALDFAALNVLAFAMSGLDGLVAFFQSAPLWAAVLSADLLIALSIVAVGMWRDAKARGTSAAPYLALTACTGSLGPLLYLLRRDAKAAASDAPNAANPTKLAASHM